MNPGLRLLHLVGAAVVTLLLLIGAGAVGAAGLPLNLLLPVPVAFVVLRCGTLTAAGSLLLTVVGLWFGSNPTTVASYLLQFGGPSLLFPALLRRGLRWDRATAVSALLAVGVAAAALAGYAAAAGTTLHGLVDGYVKGELAQALKTYGAADLPAQQLAEFKALAERTGAFLLRTYPALALVITGLVQMLTLLLLSALSRGHRYQLPGPNFRLWRAPELLVWPLIAGGFGLAFGQGLVATLALNLLTVLLPIYFLQGLAVISYFFARKGLSPLFRAFAYLLLTVLNPLPLIVTGIGVFDLWADFRKPRIKKT